MAAACRFGQYVVQLGVLHLASDVVEGRLNLRDDPVRIEQVDVVASVEFRLSSRVDRSSQID